MAFAEQSLIGESFVGTGPNAAHTNIVLGRKGGPVRILDVTLDRLRLPLDPPFAAAWDPDPRRHFDATIVRVHTDEGVTGIGSGDTMDGFDSYRHLFLGTDPLDIARQVRAIETA